MKLNYLVCLSVISLLLGLTACRPEGSESVIEPLELDVKVTDITPSSAQITVTPNHNNGTYYWNIRTLADYEYLGNDKEVLDADIAALQAAAEISGKTYEEYLASILVAGPTSMKIDTLSPEIGYCAYAFEIRSDGDPANSMEIMRFITPKTPMRVSLDITPGMTFFEVDATAESDDFCYYFDAMPESLYEQYGGTNEGAARYFRESLEYTAENRGLSIEQVVEAIGCYGKSYRRIEGLELDSPYYIYVVEIDDVGNVQNISTSQAFTLERQMSDLTVDINVKSLNSFRTEVEFVPSDDTVPYYYQMLPEEEYNQIVSDYGDYRDYAIETYGSYMSYFVATGATTATAKNLEAETDYVIFAFGYQDGVWVTDIFTELMTTPAPNPADGLNINIDILEVTNHYCEASFQPSDETVPYMFYYMTEEEFKDFGNDTLTSVQNFVTKYLAAYQELYPEYGISYLVQALSSRANRTDIFKYLDPSTKYYAWAVAVDENGLIVSQPALMEFTTGEYIVAEDCIVKDAEYRYWDGDEMAEHMIQFATFKGIAGAIVDTIAVEGSETWIGYFYEGNITDTEEYPDHYVSSNLYFTGRQNLSEGSITVFSLDWGIWTLCIAATDSDGNFGPVYRELVEVTKEGCSPIEECPLYDNFNSSVSSFTSECIIPYRFGYPKSFRSLPEFRVSEMISEPESVQNHTTFGSVFKIENIVKKEVTDSNVEQLLKVPQLILNK